MKHWLVKYSLIKLIALSLMCWLNLSVAAPSKLVLGVDRDQIYGPLLAGKNVALMVNQSSLDSNGVHTIDKLLAEQQKYGFKIVKLFSVEHGLRGKEEAGFGDDNGFDKRSNLPVVSLYGKDPDGRARANPTKQQLEDVDIVIYDLQDVGVRYFTYTLSMHYLLESLQQYNKSLMVFDRPNPVGQYVYGPLLKEENISGIGISPVPMVHGLTSGEFAKMTVNEGWLTHFDHTSWQAMHNPVYQLPPENLYVITMENYQHDMPYSLPVAPSPNLATDLAIQLYPSLGVFESTSVNSGRGSAYPFEQLGYSDKRFFVNTCYQVDESIARGGWPQGGREVCGEKISKPTAPTIQYFVDWWFKFKQNGYQLAAEWQDEANYLTNQGKIYVSRPFWLAKVIGDRQFLEQLKLATKQGLNQQQTIEMIEASWQPELDDYLKRREKYLLYP